MVLPIFYHVTEKKKKEHCTKKLTKASSTFLCNITIDRQRETNLTIDRAFLPKRTKPFVSTWMFDKSTQNTQEQVAWWLRHIQIHPVSLNEANTQQRATRYNTYVHKRKKKTQKGSTPTRNNPPKYSSFIPTESTSRQSWSHHDYLRLINIKLAFCKKKIHAPYIP